MAWWKRNNRDNFQSDRNPVSGVSDSETQRQRDTEAWQDFADPYGNTASADIGGNMLLVDHTKIADGITELFERYDMSGEPIGLTDVTDTETWFAMLAAGLCDGLCQHMAASTAAIVHRRYPAARDMPLDRLDAVVASVGFCWSYPGENLELAKRIVEDHLRGQQRRSYAITERPDLEHPGTPLYETLKSTFEVCVAVIDIAKSHPLYRDGGT